MKQQTLTMANGHNTQFERIRKPTRRDTFLATLERIVPWSALCEVIERTTRMSATVALRRA